MDSISTIVRLNWQSLLGLRLFDDLHRHVFNGLFGMVYSLAGACVSLIGMVLLKKTDLFSVVGVSMAAGVLHNLGQLLIAAFLIEDLRIFFYFPVLMFSGIAAGILVGIISTMILRRLS